MKKQPNSKRCFVCGLENPVGLHMHFYRDDEGQAITHYTVPDHYRGYPGVVHGGVTSALLDETIGRALFLDNYWAVTAKLEVRFLKPVPTEQPLTVIGRIDRCNPKAAEGSGEILLEDGTIAAVGKALYIRLPDGEVERRMDSDDEMWEVVPEEGDALVIASDDED